MSNEADWTLVDDRGRLFGLVNVVDVLIVVLVFAIIAGGIWVVFFSTSQSSAPPPETATRYATIDLGPQVQSLAKQVTPGDELRLEGNGNTLLVTDVYLFYSEGRESRTEAVEGNQRRERFPSEIKVNVLVRVETTGPVVDSDNDKEAPIRFGEHLLRSGRPVSLVTQDYTLSGDITRVDSTGDQLPVTETEFVMETTVPTSVAEEVAVGDEYVIGNSTIGTVETVTEYLTNSDRRRLLLGLELDVLAGNEIPQFAGQSVRIGETIQFQTSDYGISGTIIRQGGLEQPGTEATRTVTIQLDNIRPNRADTITEGMTEHVRETTTARILSVTTEPAEVTLVSDGERFKLGEHSRNKDVVVTVEINVRELQDGTVRFRGEPLRIGNTLSLYLGLVTVEGKLIDFDS
jgi:hypothetical protein